MFGKNYNFKIIAIYSITTTAKTKKLLQLNCLQSTKRLILMATLKGRYLQLLTLDEVSFSA